MEKLPGMMTVAYVMGSRGAVLFLRFGDEPHLGSEGASIALDPVIFVLVFESS